MEAAAEGVALAVAVASVAAPVVAAPVTRALPVVEPAVMAARVTRAPMPGAVTRGVVSSPTRACVSRRLCPAS